MDDAEENLRNEDFAGALDNQADAIEALREGMRELAEQMAQQQQNQNGQQGDALWQWGQHIDFQSIMMIYPDHNFGVVVCTNNDLLNPDVAVEIAHRALGGKIESIRWAIHLELNYREGD